MSGEMQALRAKSQESRVKGKVAIRRYGISRFALWLFVDRKMAFCEARNGFYLLRNGFL
jgi:hypothetical protein